MKRIFLLCLGVSIACAAHLEAQRGGRGAGGGAAGPPATARAAAPRDLTGYWVSVVAEHWHLRMLVPPKGEFAMLPLNAEARKVAMAWEPSRDAAGNEQCKAYGAAAIMRVPGRFYLHWADDNTLQMDIDSGTQTRLFRFAGAQGGAAAANASAGSGSLDWQGQSVARWEVTGRSGARHLRVTTTRMRPGYLRRNGVPYSENAVLDEYFDRFTEPNGDEWIVVDSILRDPQYLTQPYVSSVSLKKIADRSGWDPTPCRIDRPR